MATTPPTVHLIDGSGYVYRAFYAIRPLSTRAGVPTNAVIGFAKMLNKLLQDEKPTHLAMMFDPRGKTFRHEAYPAYKETRQSMPEDLAPQFNLIRELVECMEIPILEVNGFEADDVIATLVDQAKGAGLGVTIVSADKDLMQLVTDDVLMYDPMHDKRYDPAAVEAKWGVPPRHIADVLALTGDTSDNIPGVPKVGKKTAAKLVSTYGHVDEIIEALGQQEKLKAAERSVLEHAEEARLSKKLVTLEHRVPVTLDIDALTYRGLIGDRLIPFFRDIEAYTLIREFGLESNEPITAAPTQAPSLPEVPAQPEEGEIEVTPLDRSTYRTILTSEELREYADQLRQRGAMAIDLQTTDADPARGDILGVALAATNLAPVYVPMGHRYIGAPKQLRTEQVLEVLAPLLDDASVGKISHQLKSVYRALSRRGLSVQGLRDDTSVAAYVLDPGRASYTIDALARELLGHETIRRRDVVGTGKKMIPFDQVALDVATPYAAENAHVALELCRVAHHKLEATGLMGLYRDLEMPLLRVLGEMERAGICVDTQVLRELAVEFTERLQTIEHQAHALAGESVNLASTKQLGELFFEKLGYPVIKRTKTGYSTDAEVLETLARDYELPRIILEHRQLSKLRSTYIDALIKLADPHSHRVHTTYNQAGAATGRLSSLDPNLQNIPIRTEEGKRIRSAFVAPKGHVLLSADYSQIELRILAHLSGDERFVNAFHSERDIHRRTAMEVLTEGKEPTAEDRRRAKAINFGIIYGLSAFGLSRQLGISNKESSEYIKRYFANYPGVRAFLDRTIEDARERGYVTTLLGRRRFLPDLRSRNRTLRSAAERIAMNTPMQGTAADIIKKAMINISARLQSEGLRAKLLLQVHDELVFEVPEEEQETVTDLARQEMCNVVELAVPLVVEVGAGRTWSEAH